MLLGPDNDEEIGLCLFPLFAGDKMSVKVRKSTPITRIIAAAEKHFGKEQGSITLLYEGEGLGRRGNLWDHGVEDGDTLDIHITQLGGKPVIYLYSPTEMDASVKLTLTPEWRFSAIYPVVPSNKNDGCEQIEWNVRARQDGTLTEKNTGLEVSYLFWEAEYVGYYRGTYVRSFLMLFDHLLAGQFLGHPRPFLSHLHLADLPQASISAPCQATSVMQTLSCWPRKV